MEKTSPGEAATSPERRENPRAAASRDRSRI
jgi:hypothetical protein